MSQGPLCPNLTKKVQRKVSQIANRNFSRVMLLGGLSVNLNHLKMTVFGRNGQLVEMWRENKHGDPHFFFFK